MVAGGVRCSTSAAPPPARDFLIASAPASSAGTSTPSNVSQITLRGGKASYFLVAMIPCAGRQQGNPMTDTRENKEVSLQAIYVKIARIAAETNPIDMTAAESGHTTSSNVVCLSQVIARRRQKRPTLVSR